MDTNTKSLKEATPETFSLQSLLSLFQDSEKVKQIRDFITNHDKPKIGLKGLSGSSDAMLSAAVSDVNGSHLFILQDKEAAAYFLNNMESLLGKENINFFPSSHRRPYEIEKTDNANVLLRAEVLNNIRKNPEKQLIVTYPGALTEKVVTKKHLAKNTLSIRKNDGLSIDFIIELLFEYEFERVDFVYEPGQFAVRGGIVDIYSFSHDYPYRVEFDDELVGSIRSFDTETQLSIKYYDNISIVPNVQEKILKEERESFLQFLPDNTTIWFKNLSLIQDTLNENIEKAEKNYVKLSSEIQHLSPEEMFVSSEDLLSELKAFTNICWNKDQEFKPEYEFLFNTSPQPSFNKNFELLAENLKQNTTVGIKNTILASNPKQIERIYSIFEDIDTDVHFTSISTTLHEGFIDKDLKIACYTDHQIFDRYHKFHLKHGHQKSSALTLKELSGLHPGDFVTHIDHGIGRYDGLEKIEVNGKHQEAIRIIYKNNDLLYVSIHSLHRIAKYSAKEGTVPKMNKLGSATWQALKSKTKRKVKDIAKELIALYAKRKASKGFSFAPDTYLQHELEASFIYEDTPDQIKCTVDVKKDMEAENPMDRLICGDVGFGKTEIAVRAAFKAVSDSKQVAILAPTTILAFQHYNTFKERLKDFPCNIDYVNRFKSGAEQKKTIKKVETGEIDIIIGTHRLVSKDVKFKDLGLLIIDEEQKFGVSTKDKLKQFKVNVDTLTLTATPIPRTLQFSLMGARDLSVINTPPPNRYPVLTELHSFNEEIVRDAITYETQRGGQVFLVHNRVQNIHDVAGMVQRLCPDVRVCIGHGQMDGPKLEKVMFDFIEGEFDVLVATTIIESGLDIPNANTIIINDAHKFGLSDLHQMRGRVGRSNKKAFAYLLSPPLSSLTPEARKRLTAIEEFSDLGSGFNISMRDLDIRGAGNLLGGEQSGFITEIGFDMYYKILNEAVQELKENEFKELFEQEQNQFVKDCQIDTDLEILLPDYYVNNISERLALYRQLSEVSNEQELNDFELQLEDRFGTVPDETKELLNTLRLKWIAENLGLDKIILKSEKMIGTFVPNQESSYYQSEVFSNILSYVQQHPDVCRMKQSSDKLGIVFENIQDIQDAIGCLQPMILQEELQSGS